MLFIMAILSVSFLFCFVISYIFLSMYVYQVKKKFFYDAFSYVFGLSNIMLLSMVLDIADIGDE